MPRYLATTALTLCAVATLSAPAHPRTTVLDCAGHPQTRPTDYILACGDGNSRLASLRWWNWSAGEADGQGVNVVNDCVPYCAAGKFHNYPVRVRLHAARAGHYTELTLTFTAGRPEKTPQTITYPLAT